MQVLPHVLFYPGVPVELVHLLLQGGAGGQFGSSPLPQPEPLLLLLPHTQGPGHSPRKQNSYNMLCRVYSGGHLGASWVSWFGLVVGWGWGLQLLWAAA